MNVVKELLQGVLIGTGNTLGDAKKDLYFIGQFFALIQIGF